jgi:hypothetical protein
MGIRQQPMGIRLHPIDNHTTANSQKQANQRLVEAGPHLVEAGPRLFEAGPPLVR